MSEAKLPARLDELRAGWGIEFPAARRVLVLLATGGGDLTALVEAAALPRRRVQGILRALAAWTVSDGDRVSLDPDSAKAVLSWLADRPHGDDGTADRWDALVAEAPGLLERIVELAAGLPPSRWRLDHVPATPATIAKRALYLTRTYELGGAHLLCVGDHDLTSLAVTLAEPSARATVVDVDDRLLAYIDASAQRLGLDVTCARADLRLGLPASVAGSADLVFTDPPYTPAGIGLFLRRGLEGLRRTTPSRLLLCYGFADRGAGRAVEVQALASGLGLAFDAIHPNFSAYRGAEAIGSRSHLYVARPTRTTWPAVDRPHRLDTRIYTRGPEAEEGGAPGLSAPAVSAVAGALAAEGVTLVGDGWPEAGLASPGPARAVGLADHLARPRPGPLAVNLFPEFGAALIPALLAAPEVAVLVVPGRAWRASGLGRPTNPAAELLGTTFAFTVLHSGGDGAETVVQARRHTEPPDGPVAALHRYLVNHREARVVNAWREGLIHMAADAGRTLTKNQARAAVAATGPGRSLERLRLEELPLHALVELAELSRLSVDRLLDSGTSPDDHGPADR
jgi:hypothetical protein